MLDHRYVVLDDMSWYKPAARSESAFTATWAQTLDLLEREIEFVKGRDVTIALDVAKSNLRNDGGIKGKALVYSPGVVVSFETTKYGVLTYRCDQYVRGAATGYAKRGAKPDESGRVPTSGRVTKMAGDWQHNVRSIALGMEALRAVKRHGIAQDDQQYAGYAALPPGSGIVASGMTSSSAQEILTRESGLNVWPDNAEGRAHVVKMAKRRTHPDQNDGDDSRWSAVDEAVQVLTRTKML